MVKKTKQTKIPIKMSIGKKQVLSIKQTKQTKIKKQNYSNEINTFTKKVSATIQTKGISNDKFIDDINSLKYGKLTDKGFIIKYNQLFDGTYATFGLKYKNQPNYEQKAIESFLGSYRRNTNPKYYQQSKDKDVVKYNENLRKKTVISGKKKPKPTTQKPKRKKEITPNKYYEKIVFDGFAYNEVIKLKQVWNLEHIKKYNLLGFQEVQLVVNYNLVDIDGNIIYADLWSTFASNNYSHIPLKNLFDKAFNEYESFCNLMEQSKLIIDVIRVYTYVYREAN